MRLLEDHKSGNVEVEFRVLSEQAMQQIAVINGSLRRESINAQLVAAIERLAPPAMKFERLAIGDLPLFNQDCDSAPPRLVLRTKEAIEAADAVLFASPEHNRSISAAMKNAIDWCTRPPGTSIWPGKAVAVVGASPSSTGTATAQQHLRGILASTGAAVLPRPEIHVAFRSDLIAANGEVGEDVLRTRLSNFAEAFSGWIERMRS